MQMVGTSMDEDFQKEVIISNKDADALQDKCHISINDDDMFWQVRAIEDKNVPKDKQPVGGGVVINLEWGWAAGMSNEDRKKLTDDSPLHRYSVKTTIDMAENLRNELNSILSRHKVGGK